MSQIPLIYLGRWVAIKKYPVLGNVIFWFGMSFVSGDFFVDIHRILIAEFVSLGPSNDQLLVLQRICSWPIINTPKTIQTKKIFYLS
jgi:hypothetical protein